MNNTTYLNYVPVSTYLFLQRQKLPYSSSVCRTATALPGSLFYAYSPRPVIADPRSIGHGPTVDNGELAVEGLLKIVLS